jgi:hypothetical protein
MLAAITANQRVKKRTVPMQTTIMKMIMNYDGRDVTFFISRFGFNQTTQNVNSISAANKTSI